MKTIKIIIFATFFLGQFFFCNAQTVTSDSTKRTFNDVFSMNLKISYDEIRGNVEKNNLKLAGKFGFEFEKNMISISSEGVRSEKDNEINQENYYASLLDVYEFNSKMAAYLKTSYYTNTFKGYDSQWKAGFGYLHSFYEKDKNYFKMRLGYQAVISDVTEGENREEHLGLLGFRTYFPVMKNVTFGAEMNAALDYSNTENYFIDGYAELVFSVNKIVSLSFKYTGDYENIPVLNKEAFDRVFETALILKID